MVQSDPLFSNNGFDAIWAKLLLCCSAAFEVEAVKAGVGSVEAFHRREEAVQRRADVGIDKSCSKLIINRIVEIVVLCQDGVPVIVLGRQRFSGENDVEAGVDDPIFV